MRAWVWRSQTANVINAINLPTLLQCMVWPPGSMCSLMAARRSAGCQPPQGCPSRTGERCTGYRHCRCCACSAGTQPQHGLLSALLSCATKTQYVPCLCCAALCRRFQLRCLMEQPVVMAQPGATLSGEMRLLAHNRQSYDVHITLRAPPVVPGGTVQVSSLRWRKLSCVMRNAAAG